MAETVKEKIIRYLNDSYAAELGGLESMKDVETDAEDADLKQAISEHLTVTQSQIDRIEARLKALGTEPNKGKSTLNTILGKASHFLNAFHDDEDRQTQNLIKFTAYEQFEVASYTALKAFADAVGDYETAQLADAIKNEEQLAGEKLLRLIPQVSTSAVKKATDAPVTA